MTPGGLHIVIDARMIDHSGIGVYLETLMAGLQDLIIEDPDLETRLMFTFLGRQALFTKTLPPALGESSQRIAFRSPLYSLGEQLEAPGRIRSATQSAGERAIRSRSMEHPVVFWPHYNFPLRWRGPMVVTVHDLIHTHHPPKRGTKLYQAMLLRALRRRLLKAERGGPQVHVLTVSRHVKVLLQRLWRFPPHRVWNVGEALPPGYRPPKSEAEFHTAMEQAGRSFRIPKRYWLAVGLHKPHKNFNWLLDQLGRYWAAGEFPEVELVIGGTNQSTELLRAIDADPRLRGRVKLLPPMPMERLRAAYWGAEALLFPSLTEGFGLPVLEAMACGTPVVCARRAPMNEYARDVAWFFDPQRPSDAPAASIASTVRNASGPATASPDGLFHALRAISGSPDDTPPAETRPPDLPGNAPPPTPGLPPPSAPTSSPATSTVSASLYSTGPMSASPAPRSPDDDIDARLRRGIARAREHTPAAFARRVLDIWHRAALPRNQ